MTRFVGLDVSQKLTALCVVDETGRRLWRGQCGTDPGQIERMVRGHAGGDARIGIETGPMTPWLRLWCIIQVVDVRRSLGAVSNDPLRDRRAEVGHLVQHRAGDLGLGFLGWQGPGAEAAADDGLVAEHGRSRVRPPAVADRPSPPHATLVPDHLEAPSTWRLGGLRVSRPHSAFTSMVRCRTSRSRVRCSISTACCSAVLIGTKRMLGRVTALQIASALAASVLPRLTYGFTYEAGISRTSWPSALISRAQ